MNSWIQVIVWVTSAGLHLLTKITHYDGFKANSMKWAFFFFKPKTIRLLFFHIKNYLYKVILFIQLLFLIARGWFSFSPLYSNSCLLYACFLPLTDSENAVCLLGIKIHNFTKKATWNKRKYGANILKSFFKLILLLI